MPAPVLLAMLGHVLFSSATFLIAKVALGQLEPLALAQLRFVLATAALLGLCAARGLPVPKTADLPALATLGLLGTTINQGLFLLGLARTTPSHAALLYALTPVLVLCLAILRGQERLRPLRLVGVLLAFAGVGILLFGRGLAFEARRLTGDLLILVAVVAWALYTVRSRELLARVEPLALTGWAMVFGTLFFLPVGAPAALVQDYGHVTAFGWWGLAYLALVTSVLSYLIWSFALSRVDASRVAVFTNLQPIVTALLAWWALAEPLTLHFAGAAGAVLLGLWLVERG